MDYHTSRNNPTSRSPTCSPRSGRRATPAAPTCWCATSNKAVPTPNAHHPHHADSRDLGDQTAIAHLGPDIARLFGTADGAEGVQSFIERRPPSFTDR